MNKETNVIEDIVYSNPQLLLGLNNSKELGLYYLPYSVGIEFECDEKDSYDLEEFKSIPNIISVNVDDSEQRYRIPNGLNGLLCLYELSQTLHRNSLLNFGSGIHYHIDFTDNPDCINQILVDKHKDWILEELDTWNYKGTYNAREVSIGSRRWIRFNKDTFYNKKTTMEVRIGEMTFDYSLLVKRIIHCNSIARKFKSNSNHEVTLGNLNRFLKQNKQESNTEEQISNIVNSRVIKWSI